MWEYKWIEVELGDAGGLTELGLDDWEAVSSIPSSEAFGRRWVGVLMKRAAVPRALVDLAVYEANATSPQGAAAG